MKASTMINGKKTYQPVRAPVIGYGNRGDPAVRLPHGQVGFVRGGYEKDKPPDEGTEIIFQQYSDTGAGNNAKTTFAFGRMLKVFPTK